MLTLNQYILLDPILLCFMTASVLGMVKLSKATHFGENFSRRWWYWLFFTGTMLACTISVKFVGLFVVLLVGLHTINDLWIILGDLTKPVVSNFDQRTAWQFIYLPIVCGIFDHQITIYEIADCRCDFKISKREIFREKAVVQQLLVVVVHKRLIYRNEIPSLKQ